MELLAVSQWSGVAVLVVCSGGGCQHAQSIARVLALPSIEPGCPGFSLDACHVTSLFACLVDLGLQPLEGELVPGGWGP